MESNDSSVSSSSSPPDLRFLKLDDSKISFPNAQQFRDSCQPQEFSLPMPIMKYIWENITSPEVYQKLIKSCKFFFLKNPIVVLNNLTWCYGWECCNGDKCTRRYECKHKREKIDVKKLEEKKIWVSNSFNAYHNIDEYERNTVVSRFIPKINRLNIQDLSISNQNISLNDLKFLGTGVKECRLAFITVYYDITLPRKDWEVVPFEDVIKVFSGAKSLSIGFYSDYDNATCKSYGDFIAACSNIEKIELIRIPDIFDIVQFYQSLKLSKCRTLFCISSEFFDIERRKDIIIAEILATDLFEFIPPVIKYYGQDKIKLAKMKEIQAAGYDFFSTYKRKEMEELQEK